MKTISMELTKSGNSEDAMFIKKMEYLLTVVQDLSTVSNLEQIQIIVRKAAYELTDCDGAIFVLIEGEECFYIDEDAISPLYKGQRFPLKTCISGEMIQNSQSVIIEDIYTDGRIPYASFRPSFLRSMVLVPIRRGAPLGAIGNYWAEIHKTTDQELILLQALADSTSIAMKNVHLHAALSKLGKENDIRI